MPDAVVLQEWSTEVADEAEKAPASGRWPLTAAELRLLHYLPTHLSFREIADELVVSINTVKSQGQSVYRKLGVASRREAVACAEAAGLVAPDGRVSVSSRLEEPPPSSVRSDR
jgi:DNA-binding CsgD family transcriptional regulator